MDPVGSIEGKTRSRPQLRRPPEPLLGEVVVVLPAFEEESRVGFAVHDVIARGYSALVVDDGSSDATAAAAEAAGAFVLRHPVNRGQGAALRTGMDFALARGARGIVTFDADGQHDAADLDALVAPLLAGACDVVLGSRFLGRADGIPLSRRIVLKLGVLFTRLTSGLAVSDTHNGLRAFTADAARRIELSIDGMAHASEILEQIRRAGLRWREVAVRVRYTAESIEKGQSSWNAAGIAARVLWRRLAS